MANQRPTERGEVRITQYQIGRKIEKSYGKAYTKLENSTRTIKKGK